MGKSRHRNQHDSYSSLGNKCFRQEREQTKAEVRKIEVANYATLTGLHLVRPGTSTTGNAYNTLWIGRDGVNETFADQSWSRDVLMPHSAETRADRSTNQNRPWFTNITFLLPLHHWRCDWEKARSSAAFRSDAAK